MATVAVKNVDRLLKKMDNIAGVDVIKPMRKAVKFVHAQAKTLCPVDTGQLRASIHMEVNQKLKTIEGRVYTNVQYAPYVEFGTGSKGNGSYPYKIKGLSLSYKDKSWVYTPDGENFYRTNGQRAQPYMYPALSRNKKYIKELFNTSLRQEIVKSCKGGR